MNFNEYQDAANRTAKWFPSVGENLMHAQMGKATEGGEFATIVKRHVIYGKPLTQVMIDHIREELGDDLWYTALACTAIGTTMGQVARENIAKLKDRFPEKYSDEAAEARADKAGADARNS